MLSAHRQHLALRAIACAAALTVFFLPVRAAHAQTPYVNPFSSDDNYYVGRTDMGVDICLNKGDAIRAIGNGVVTGIMRNWYAGQPYIWYQLTDGPDAGRYVYVAEQITHLAHVGQTLTAGQPLARYAAKGTCIEMGWSTADGETLAAATTGYTEGQATVAGVSFARVLISVGVQGNFELQPTPVKAKVAKKKHHRRPKRR
jgi:hypothetical protein